jgi:hypothetical protein
MVECKLCKAQFPGHGAQGHGCASSVYEKDGAWYVQGFYGSRLHDMRRYKFVGLSGEMQPHPTEPVNPVCDVCVEVWVRMEAVVYDRECEP